MVESTIQANNCQLIIAGQNLSLLLYCYIYLSLFDICFFFNATETNQTCMYMQAWLILVTSRATSTTSTLKFASLATNKWLGIRVGNTSSTKVLVSFTAVFGSAEENSVFAGGCDEGELIKGKDLAACLEDTGTSGLGDAESDDSELGDFQESDIVGDRADKDSNFIFFTCHELDKFGEGERWAVHLGHEEASEDDFVEIRVCTAHQEAVELQGWYVDGSEIESHRMHIIISKREAVDTFMKSKTCEDRYIVETKEQRCE